MPHLIGAIDGFLAISLSIEKHFFAQFNWAFDIECVRRLVGCVS